VAQSNANPLRASALHYAAGLLASLPVGGALAARRQLAVALARRVDAGTIADEHELVS